MAGLRRAPVHFSIPDSDREWLTGGGGDGGFLLVELLSRCQLIANHCLFWNYGLKPFLPTIIATYPKKQQLLKRNYFRLANTNYTAPFGLSKNAFFMLIFCHWQGGNLQTKTSFSGRQAFRLRSWNILPLVVSPSALKGQCHEIVFPYFLLKKLCRGHISTG